MNTPKRKLVRDWDRIIFRVPDGMRDELEELAADNCLPLNSQLLVICKQAIDGRKAASNPTA